MGNLSKDQRRALPDDEFAVPRKRALPMHDATHAKLAWDMVDRTKDLTPDERTEARRRIIKRAHDLGVDTADWHITAAVSFEAMALDMPEVGDHPNQMPFSGVLTRVDLPSDEPPGGSHCHRTLIPAAVAEAGLPTLLGMAVDYKPNFDGHDRRQKIGIITGATVKGTELHIQGFFYAKDFPEECDRIKREKNRLGFSFEADARIHDMDADIWVIDHCVFTGAAVLYKHLAAYTTTSLAATAEENEMSKEILDALAALSASVEDMKKEVATIKAGASLGGPIIDQVKPHVEACNACADAMEAAGVGTHPEQGHAAILRRMAAHMAASAALGKVPHIYNDHSYFGNGGVLEAGQKLDAAAILEKANAESAKKIDELGETIKSLNTKIADLQAGTFRQSEPPVRKTLTPEIQTLLAKGNIKDGDMKDGKLSVDQVNQVLDAAKLRSTEAIEFKLKLREAGLMPAGRQ